MKYSPHEYPHIAAFLGECHRNPDATVMGVHAGSLAREMVIAMIRASAELEAEIKTIMAMPPVLRIDPIGNVDWPAESFAVAIAEAGARAGVMVGVRPRTADMDDIADAECQRDARG